MRVYYIHKGVGGTNNPPHTHTKKNIEAMAMEGVWSSHTEAAPLILGLGSILTRQYLRAAKAWQVHGKGVGVFQLVPAGRSTPSMIFSHYKFYKVQLQPLTSRSMYV